MRKSEGDVREAAYRLIPRLSVALLAFWWPVLTANPVGFGGWRDRVVFHHCRPQDQPARLPADRNGRPLAWIRVLHGSPPSGWCWV